MQKEDTINNILDNAVQVVSKKSLIARLNGGTVLKIKLGADPSRPDLHLGHTVILRKLRMFQELGHEIHFVIGDFTGMIGDPTGRSKTRPALTLEQTRKSGETYLKQVTKILDPAKTKIHYNSEWLSKLDFAQVIRLASKFTVAQILARDDFKNRYAGNIPISLHELLYPIAQGYDSVALDADVEIGGTDQTFNLLVGRALQSDYGQTPQEVITYPLLVGLDGKEKMSKSLDNYIGLDEPAEIMFEKAMRVPDECLIEYFTLTTDIGAARSQSDIHADIRKAHLCYADTIVTMYHGKSAAVAAQQRYSQIAAGALPANMAELSLSPGETADGQIKITQLLLKTGFAASLGEAKRNIAGKGVKINGETIEDINLLVDLIQPVVVQFGKNRFCKVLIR